MDVELPDFFDSIDGWQSVRALPEPVETQERRPATRYRIRWSIELPISAGHFQEIAGVKEGLHDRAGVARPGCVLVHRKCLAGSFTGDLNEPGVERTTGRQALQ